MKKRPVRFLLIFSAIILFIFLLMQPWEVWHFRSGISLLFPKGIIALKERNLMFVLQVIMLLVVIPVYALTYYFSWKYSANNPKGDYDPDIVDNKLAEYIWWGLPFVFTLFIAILTWYRTYELDPFKSLEGEKKQVTIQVVALQWKWLFLYPEEGVASVNFFQIPEKTPIRFEITADAPMNSFWLPDLGGQIYAMPKMKTTLNIIANEIGDYRGSSANLSGEGFAGMHFITRASTAEDYQKWIEKAKQSSTTLDWENYEKLAKPSSNHPVTTFQMKEKNLFNRIMMKYMHPSKEH